jgi:hypothetical protein
MRGASNDAVLESNFLPGIKLVKAVYERSPRLRNGVEQDSRRPADHSQQNSQYGRASNPCGQSLLPRHKTIPPRIGYTTCAAYYVLLLRSGARPNANADTGDSESDHLPLQTGGAHGVIYGVALTGDVLCAAEARPTGDGSPVPLVHDMFTRLWYYSFMPRRGKRAFHWGHGILARVICAAVEVAFLVKETVEVVGRKMRAAVPHRRARRSTLLTSRSWIRLRASAGARPAPRNFASSKRVPHGVNDRMPGAPPGRGR